MSFDTIGSQAPYLCCGVAKVRRALQEEPVRNQNAWAALLFDIFEASLGTSLIS